MVLEVRDDPPVEVPDTLVGMSDVLPPPLTVSATDEDENDSSPTAGTRRARAGSGLDIWAPRDSSTEMDVKKAERKTARVVIVAVVSATARSMAGRRIARGGCQKPRETYGDSEERRDMGGRARLELCRFGTIALRTAGRRAPPPRSQTN